MPARAHRMGQTRSVVVHRLLARESVDERIVELLGDKAALFEAYARASALAEASPEATETSFVRRALELERERLGLTGRGWAQAPMT